MHAPATATAEPMLLRSVADGVVTLALNRPRQYNALSGALLIELQAALDARTALAHGLVNRVVPEAGLDAEVARLAHAITGKSPAAVAAGKKMFYEQVELGLEEAYALASEAITRGAMSEDGAEGIAAFVEKRKPVWKNK